MHHFIIIGLIAMLCLYSLMPSKKTKKSKRRKRKTKKHKPKLNFIDQLFFSQPLRQYDKYNVISKTYLKYHEKIIGEDHYLTWKYSGSHQNKSTYNPILLPYKNKQNEFKIHNNDHIYLKQFYEKYNLYNSMSKMELDKILFITSDYNMDKEDYLELIKHGNNTYIIKASPWSRNIQLSYLHIDDKNRLYFDSVIKENVAQFMIC